MYVGTVYDFFYKPKNWIFQQPKFDQKQDKAYINLNGRVYRINELNGEMILCNTVPKKINFPKSEKPKKIKLKNKLNINSITKEKDKDDENYNNNCMNSENIKSISARDTKFKDFLLKSPALTDIKSDKNKNTITSDNNSTLQNENLGKNQTNNNIKYIIPKNNNNIIKYNHFNNKSNEQIINSNNLATNLNSLKNSIFQNSIKNDKLFGNKTILYFNKTNKKYFKPKIAFGQKILKSLSVNDKKVHNKKNKANLLYLIHKQHNNNITGEGRINEKIYDKENGDNLIFKAYKDQIFKEKIEIGLKKKYKFFEDNNGDLKVPLITHQNFCFYRGYSFSDNRRTPIDHKLFFNYIKKDKLKEQKESENKIRNKY